MPSVAVMGLRWGRKMLDSFSSILVLDASTMINILSTTFAEKILRAIPVPVHVAKPTSHELKYDPRDRTKGPERFRGLVEAGLVTLSPLTAECEKVFFGLVSAPV